MFMFRTPMAKPSFGCSQTGLAKHVVTEAQQLVEDHLQEIVDAWNEHFSS